MLKCFMLERTDIVRVYLRRYHSSDDKTEKCPGKYGYHDGQVFVGAEEAIYETKQFGSGKPYTIIVNKGEKFKDKYLDNHDDPKWPTICDYCAYKFTEDDAWQIFTELMYQRSDNGELVGLRNAPEGSMYFAWWFADNSRYEPEGALYAVCPGGHPWNIDSRASNCTMPDDDIHRCWIRHGEPPNITVDKNGNTCAAGGGSIVAGNYHGFLQNGHFT